MRITIRVKPRIEAEAEPRDGVPRFEPLPAARGRFPFALTASLAIHLAGGAIAPPALEILDQWSRPIVDFRRAMIVPKDAIPLLVRMPEEPLLVRIPKLRAAARPKLRSIRAKTRSAPAQVAQTQRPRPLLRTVKREAPVATAILLQPKLDPVKIEDIPDLRSLAVWTGRSPRPDRKPVSVGSVEPVKSVVAAALKTAPELPFPEPVRSPIPAPALPAQASVRPKLFLPPSGSSPLQAESLRLEEPVIPPGSTMAGEAAAIIALSSMSAKPGDVLPVPPGSMVVIGSEGTAKPPAPPPAQNPMPEAANRRPVEQARTNPAPTPQAPKPAAPPLIQKRSQHVARVEEASSSQTNLGGSPGTNRTSDSPSTASISSIKTLSGDIRVQTAPDGTVSLTYPSNGNFDVVVVESALPEALAQIGQGLSGRPIHTAYINVGSSTEWMIQYCLPSGGTAGPSQQGMVVTLDSPAPLKAPYVLEAKLPAESAWKSPAYQVFHGLLNLRGKLEQLTAVRAGVSAAVLLESLRQWTFRPASMGGTPKVVEVLLVIPPRANP
jgi:hypothetical protein